MEVVVPDPTLSDAIKEAYASAPTTSVILHTLEIYHPAFTEPIRVVRDRANVTATLESTAPRNASQSVEFVAFPFDILPPEVSVSGMPQCKIEIDNVSREILAQIEAAMAVGGDDLITVIYRAFLSDDLSGPENDPPLTLTIVSLSATPFRITATAGFWNPNNRKFPSKVYDGERFPGLVAI
jgi:hypothetical protein